MAYNSKYTGAEVDNALSKALTAIQEHQDISGKQDVISDLAEIRANSKKGATALQSVPSEYVTETELSNKGYATSSSLESGLSSKVDKVTGKQLSTEDFTTALKNKLSALNNYDDTAINSAISKLRTDFDTLVSGDTTTAIKSFNEIIAFLDGISDSEDLEGIIASIEQQISLKQDKISDLDDIRSGAAKGATALQSYTEKYTGTYSKPSGGIPKTDLATAVQTSLGKADTALQSIPSEYITESELNAKGYTTNVGTITGIKMNGASKGTSGVVDLGTVITKHQDISGKLDIATAASTYLSKVDASNLYLGKTAKASSASSADVSTKATQDASGNVITTTYATKTEVSNKQDKVLKFTNKSATTWVSDSTYSSFPYRCDISCSGVTSDMFAEVVFDIDESTSGYYAPLCETKANIVSIWSSVNESITIPTIIITK